MSISCGARGADLVRLSNEVGGAAGVGWVFAFLIGSHQRCEWKLQNREQ
jgi:hypothetical protein